MQIQLKPVLLSSSSLPQQTANEKESKGNLTITRADAPVLPALASSHRLTVRCAACRRAENGLKRGGRGWMRGRESEEEFGVGVWSCCFVCVLDDDVRCALRWRKEFWLPSAVWRRHLNPWEGPTCSNVCPLWFLSFAKESVCMFSSSFLPLSLSANPYLLGSSYWHLFPSSHIFPSGMR